MSANLFNRFMTWWPTTWASRNSGRVRNVAILAFIAWIAFDFTTWWLR
jgi:hypothetical protein